MSHYDRDGGIARYNKAKNEELKSEDCAEAHGIEEVGIVEFIKDMSKGVWLDDLDKTMMEKYLTHNGYKIMKGKTNDTNR